MIPLNCFHTPFIMRRVCAPYRRRHQAMHHMQGIYCEWQPFSAPRSQNLLWDSYWTDGQEQLCTRLRTVGIYIAVISSFNRLCSYSSSVVCSAIFLMTPVICRHCSQLFQAPSLSLPPETSTKRGKNGLKLNCRFGYCGDRLSITGNQQWRTTGNDARRSG